MIAFLLRRKAVALIWQYLDGVIPPDRFDLLQRLLRKDTWVRRQFVDCAVLNALLFAYFNPGRYSAVPAANGQPQRLDDLDFECEACNLDIDAELEAIEREEMEREERERRTKRPAG